MYLEFTLAETLEHFLACHQHAFEYFGGVVQQVWVDNCKVAVLSRAAGAIAFNPRYLDFAQHYGFQIRACGVGQPQEKRPRPFGSPMKDDQLLNWLQYLKLSHFREHHQALAREATEKHWTPLDFLIRLVEGEVLRRKDRATQRRLQAARFPVIKILQQYDWTWPTKINRLQVQNLFRLAFLKDKDNDKAGADFLFQVFSQRYEHGSTIVTTNQAYKHLGQDV